MTLDYFYGAQADQFAFYRIPKALFTDERFKSISAEAKILYGILLDRMSLSRKNGWLDEQGRVFIIFTLEEVMEAIGCADQKATKLLNELDSKAGLIERKRQGLGKPNLIFVKNFVDNSTGSIPPAPESRKSRGSNTDSNYTDLSETETYPFPSGQVGGHGQPPVDKMGRDMDEREQYRAILEDNLEYDILLENNPYDRDTIAEIMELLLDTICSKRQYIRIAGDDKPAEVVRSQFLKLNCTHIEYVLSSFKENASKVRNIKQYLLASLLYPWNAFGSLQSSSIRNNRYSYNYTHYCEKNNRFLKNKNEVSPFSNTSRLEFIENYYPKTYPTRFTPMTPRLKTVILTVSYSLLSTPWKTLTEFIGVLDICVLGICIVSIPISFRTSSGNS